MGAKILKTGHVTLTTPIIGYVVIPTLKRNTCYLWTKFGVSRFSHSANIIVDVKTENVTLTTPF